VIRERSLTIGRALCRAICIVAFMLGAAGPSSAQPAAEADPLVYFYKDPRPDRLVGLLESTGRRPKFQNWQAYPPLAGFFAVIFAADPASIDKLVPQSLDPMLVEALAAALQLSGNGPRANALLAPGGVRDDTLRAEFANLPARIEDLEIATPTHLDILWGASFASGDGRYARMIIDFFAETANRSEDIAIDVAKVAIAMAGGPDEALTTLRGKYGDALTTEIIHAAAALWALHSNAEQHGFIDKTARDYLAEAPETPARRAISAIWQIR